MNKLGVFAKYWAIGNVKTRLAADIGPQLASRVYFRFVQHLVQKLADVAATRFLYVAPPGYEDEFGRVAGPQWEVRQQSEGDLGQRMSHFFDDVLEDQNDTSMEVPPSRVVLIGTDTPQVTVEDIEQAFFELQNHDVVLGPTLDGGYYLIGLRQNHPCLFHEVAWSTPNVFSQTCRAAQSAGLSVATLRQRTDVDYLDDLKEMESEIRRAPDSLDLGLLDDLNRIMNGS